MVEVPRRSVAEIRELIKICVEMGVTELRMDDVSIKVEKKETMTFLPPPPQVLIDTDDEDATDPNLQRAKERLIYGSSE
jgi:hypothetical protein